MPVCDINSDVYNKNNKYSVLRCLSIPNRQNTKYIDDEDYIYMFLDMPKNIKHILHHKQKIQDYVINYITTRNIIINYNETFFTEDIIIAKTLYIYQYVHYYYNNLIHLNCNERVFQLPNEFLDWITNLIILIKFGLDNDMINSNLYESNENEYVNELIFGLNLATCQLKMLINHCKIYKSPLHSLEKQYLKKFFRILNNICVIMLFINFNA